MKPANAKEEFETFVVQTGTTIADLTPGDAIRLMIAFYQQRRADGLLEIDGDMLLFQWNTGDSDHGRSFQLDITRQFIELGDEDEDGMSQISLTCHFPPSAELDALASGNEWCQSSERADEFERLISSHEAYRAVASAKPDVVSLQYINI